MKVTCMINDYSNPAQPCIRIHNAWEHPERVTLEVGDKQYTVSSQELISAIKRATLNNL